jgi:uncharacterized protein (DUF362 family)
MDQAAKNALRPDAKVAIVPCRSYGADEVRASMDKCFDLLGGIGSLVKNKTVTIKLNLTGNSFGTFLDRPVGETYITHVSTALALGSALFAAGARRVRFVESTGLRKELEATLAQAGWDVRSLAALGRLEFENTRNLGTGKSYSHMKVPGGGYMFSSFDLNRAYQDTDVMISMAKLKNHSTAGVTLSMKNLFGITPVSLYGNAAGSEDATDFRGVMHNPNGLESIKLPGIKDDVTSTEPGWRVPRITTDLCAARPIHLAIVDGITAMSGGEGPWCGGGLKATTPGVLIAGLNPVSTDSVATAVMGYSKPNAPRGVKPFGGCDNHILLAEQVGLGTAELSRIDLRGTPLEKARYPYG